MEKPEERNLLQRPWCILEDNIKMGLKVLIGGVWVGLMWLSIWTWGGLL
jgi:hypothetical protein